MCSCVPGKKKNLFRSITSAPVAAAAATTKLLQSSPTLCDPIDGSRSEEHTSELQSR